MKRAFIILGVIAFMMSFLSIQSSAQDSLLFNYQGYLTDQNGAPLTGQYNLIFKLYSSSTGPYPLWTENYNNVNVVNGLFNVVLGSNTLLTPTVLDGSERYIGITVGGDSELSPRTLLTGSPKAAVAGRVSGDILINEGILMLKDFSGDTGISLQRTPDGASIKMFDPQPEPPGKMFELFTSSASGPNMSFFDHGGEVMGVEPSPFNGGFTIRMFDPQPEPPGIMFEILTTFDQQGLKSADQSAVKSTAVNFYSELTGAGNQQLLTLSTTGDEALIRMGPGAPIGSSHSYNAFLSNSTESSINILGPSAFVAAYPIVLKSTGTGANVGIGTASPTEALDVLGNIYLTGTINSPSDEAFKKDIEPIEHPLEDVEKINGVTYRYRTDEFPDKNFDNTRQVGLIAQDVKEVLPEAVRQDKDGYYSIDYTRITPLLVEAIKELKAQNELLKKRLDQLEKKNK